MSMLSDATKLLVTFVAVLMLQTGAQASPITATWTATVTSSAYDSAWVGQSAVLSFTFDPATFPSPLNSHAVYVWDASSPLLFSSASARIGNGPSIVVVNPGDTGNSEIFLGDPALIQHTGYQNYVSDNTTGRALWAYFFDTNETAVVTTVDPARLFSDYNLSNATSQGSYLIFDGLRTNFVLSSVVLTAGGPPSTVPAPGSAALMGFGLLGIFSARKRKAVA